MVLPRLSGPLGPSSVFIALPFPDSEGSFYLVTGRFQFFPHVGRGLSTVTTWSEWCASLGSMGNLSGTQYPPQSTWSLAVPHVRCPINRRPSIPLVPKCLHSG